MRDSELDQEKLELEIEETLAQPEDVILAEPAPEEPVIPEEPIKPEVVEKPANKDKEAKTAAGVAEEKKKRKKRNIVVSIIIAIIIIILLLLRGCSAFQPKTDVPVDRDPIVVDSGAQEGEKEKADKDKIINDLNEKVAAGMIRITINPYPIFENGSAEGNILIVNAESNNYPQVVELFLLDEETQEEVPIYKSGAIPVGSRIDNITLDKVLPAGEYKCIAYFNNVDLETNEYLGKAAGEVTITILA